MDLEEARKTSAKAEKEMSQAWNRWIFPFSLEYKKDG